MLIMRLYLGIAINLCKFTRTPVSFLLHPLDIIGGDKLSELAFFPGMNVDTENKVHVFKTVLTKIKRNFELVQISEFIKIPESS